jgi:hypothetical protein
MPQPLSYRALPNCPRPRRFLLGQTKIRPPDNFRSSVSFYRNRLLASDDQKTRTRTIEPNQKRLRFRKVMIDGPGTKTGFTRVYPISAHLMRGPSMGEWLFVPEGQADRSQARVFV